MQPPPKGNRMKAIQVFVAASEAATGVMLLVCPSVMDGVLKDPKIAEVESKS